MWNEKDFGTSGGAGFFPSILVSFPILSFRNPALSPSVLDHSAAWINLAIPASGPSGWPKTEVPATKTRAPAA